MVNQVCQRHSGKGISRDLVFSVVLYVLKNMTDCWLLNMNWLGGLVANHNCYAA